MITSFKILSILLFLAAAAPVYSAPCCGGGAAVPSVITNDDFSQVSMSLSSAIVIGDAPPSGLSVFRAQDDDEITQTMQLEGAILLSDRWQSGIRLPMVRRIREFNGASGSGSNVGDITFTLGYEALPEWEYSEWKPRGFAFAALRAPTGTSIYESGSLLTTDVTGRGFWSLSVGAILVKSWTYWDAVFSAEVHKEFSTEFQTATGLLELSPGFGSSAVAGVGYSPGSRNIRYGASIGPSYEDGIKSSQNGISSVTASKLVWNASLQISWLPNDNWATSISYTDQTLFGPVINTTLDRTFALRVMKRFGR
jgi:hypothetical protein